MVKVKEGKIVHSRSLHDADRETSDTEGGVKRCPLVNDSTLRTHELVNEKAQHFLPSEQEYFLGIAPTCDDVAGVLRFFEDLHWR